MSAQGSAPRSVSGPLSRPLSDDRTAFLAYLHSPDLDKMWTNTPLVPLAPDLRLDGSPVSQLNQGQAESRKVETKILDGEVLPSTLGTSGDPQVMKVWQQDRVLPEYLDSHSRAPRPRHQLVITPVGLTL